MPASAEVPSRRRTVVVIVAAVVAALALSAVLAYVRRDTGSPQEFFKADKAGQPVRAIGPLKGADVEKYLDSRHKALSKASGPRIAVVSLDRFTAEREARASVGNSEVVSMIAAAPGGPPSVATRDLKTWADQQRDEAKVERDGFKSQLVDVDDPATKRQFEAEVQRLNALIDRISPTAPVVFAAIVRAPVERLREIAKSPGVRLVDVGSSDKVGETPTYTGIRPEETQKAGEPATRPL
jgi:hypothetical protein